MGKVKNLLPNGSYWYNKWVEFENQIGIDKQINELDKICPSVQAVNYFKEYKNHNLEEFQA
jgi:hypothetical protein